MTQAQFHPIWQEMVDVARATRIIQPEDTGIDALEPAYYRSLAWVPVEQLKTVCCYIVGQKSKRFPAIADIIEVTPAWTSLTSLIDAMIDMFVEAVTLGPVKTNSTRGVLEMEPTLQEIPPMFMPFFKVVGGTRTFLMVAEDTRERARIRKELADYLQFMLTSGEFLDLVLVASDLFGVSDNNTAKGE